MKNVFEFDDYKVYLSSVEVERSAIQRGFRSRLAEALGCQNSYVSQVLNTDANLSLEQAHVLTRFLGLSENEQKYFLLLVELARAGTPALKAYFLKDLDALRAGSLNLKNRVAAARSLSDAHQTVYYSSWIYPTIHMLTTIPAFRTVARIATVMGLDEATVAQAALFLVSAGLVNESEGEFSPGETQIHLERGSPQIRSHHTVWRLAAVASLDVPLQSDMHYSTVSSLSRDDAKRLHARFAQIVQDYVQTVQASKEETIYNFNLDFYCLEKWSGK